MNQNLFETIIGIVIVLIAILFLSHIVKINNLSNKNLENQVLFAKFNSIDGIKVGSDVKVGGVKVGSVNNLVLNSDFSITVEILILKTLQIPIDSVLSVATSGIFGSKYLSIKPGFEENFIQNKGLFINTQSSLNLEDLISKFATK